jgi:hypothetical protein
MEHIIEVSDAIGRFLSGKVIDFAEDLRGIIGVANVPTNEEIRVHVLSEDGMRVVLLKENVEEGGYLIRVPGGDGYMVVMQRCHSEGMCVALGGKEGLLKTISYHNVKLDTKFDNLKIHKM